MFIYKLVFENFGVYRGRQEIDFSVSKESPIVLFGGKNGAGKTTLLNGLQFVLYGKRAANIGRTSADHKEFLIEAVHREESDDGEFLYQKRKAGVEIEFEAVYDGELARFYVTRSWEKSGSESLTNFPEKLTVFQNGLPSEFLTKNWAEVMEEVLPHEISSLFLFDGEKIEALADPKTAADVTRSAIESLLGLNLLDRLATDLVALERRKRSASVDEVMRAEAKELEEIVEGNRLELDTATQDLAACQNEIDKAEKNLEAARETFRREGGEAYEKRVEFEQSREVALERITELNEKLFERAATSLPLRLIKGLMERTLKQCQSERESAEAEVLSGVLVDRDEKTLGLLKGSLDGDGLEEVESFLQRDRSERAAKADLPCHLNVSVESSQRLAFLQSGDLERQAQEGKTEVSLRAEVEGRLEEADRQLASVPSVEAVAAAAKQNEEASEQLLKAKGRFEVRLEVVEAAVAKLESAEAQLDKWFIAASGVADEEEDTQRIIRHSEKARETLKEYRVALLERHLGRIEAAVLASLRELLHKPSLVLDLRINPTTFEFELFDKRGEPLPSKSLSAGERQILALSLLWGLAKVSGKSLPTVVDTPLGRLDSEHRQLLVDRYFPAAGRQIVLLSTNEEIDKGLLESLGQSVGVKYLLHHHDDEGWTEAIPGYFWEDEENVA